MADDMRKKKKKKRGRSKIILRSCFRSSTTTTTGDDVPSSSSLPKDDDEKLGRDFVSEVDLVNGCDNDDDDCCTKRSTSSSSSRRRISRIVKAVLFNAKLKKKKKNRPSSSKSSVSSDTSPSSLSTEKVDKSSFHDGNAYARECSECPDVDDSVSYSRRSNLFSSSSRTTSSAYSTSSRTTSSAYTSSSLSSTNSNSGSTSNQKPSSLIENILEFGYHPLSSNSSASKKSNPNNNSNYNSSLCFDQKVSSSKSTPIHSISPSASHQKGLSRLNSTDSTTSVSSNVFLLMNSNPDKNIIFGGNSWNVRWCLFLILSLVVLMVWGRIFSIMCTSIWFYFVPCRRIKRVDSATSVAELVDTDSKHYKKRVIMAGLLDRTRNPIR